MLDVLRKKLESSYNLLQERAGKSPARPSSDEIFGGDQQQSTQLLNGLWTQYGEAWSWELGGQGKLPSTPSDLLLG
jgi:hypothetical protein